MKVRRTPPGTKPPRMKSLHASATREKSSGDIILKVVNASAQALATDIGFSGIARLSGPARAVVLASYKPTDENSLANLFESGPGHAWHRCRRIGHSPHVPRQFGDGDPGEGGIGGRGLTVIGVNRRSPERGLTVA